MNPILTVFFIFFFIAPFPFYLVFTIEYISLAYEYWHNYFCAKDSYEKNPYAAKENLRKLKEELQLMEYAEFKFLLNGAFGTTHSTFYDEGSEKRLLYRRKGYEKGLEAAIKKQTRNK